MPWAESENPKPPRRDRASRPRLNLGLAFGMLAIYVFFTAITGAIASFVVVFSISSWTGMTFQAAFESVDQVLVPLRALLGPIISVGFVVWLACGYAGYVPALGRPPARRPFGQTLEVTAFTAVAMLLAGTVWLLAHYGAPALFDTGATPVDLSRQPLLALAVFFFNAILLQPLAEEFLFRGVFFDLLHPRYSVGLAALIVSVLFLAIHIPRVYAVPFAIVPLSGLAALTILARIRTSSLLAPMLIHVAYNSVLVASEVW